MVFVASKSRIHTEVVISTEPSWISQIDAMDSNASNMVFNLFLPLFLSQSVSEWKPCWIAEKTDEVEERIDKIG